MTWNTQKLPTGKPGSPERRAYSAAWKAAHPAQVAADRASDRARRGTRTWYASNRDRALTAGRAHKLRLRYGITTSEWRALFAAQNGRCKICGTDEPGKRGFQVDHCHTTSAVRSLLCGPCNRMLGAAGDDVARLRAGADYVDAFRVPA